MTAVMAGPSALASAAAGRRPNREAEKLTGRTYVSHSQLSLMRSCPRKFAFLYVEKVAADFIPASLIFGGSIHSALELYFRATLEGLTVTPDALLSAYHDSWRRQKEKAGGDIPIRFAKTDSYDTLHALADRMIAAFLASPLATPKGTILGIEEELRVVLDTDLPDLLAVVDLVTMTDGALHVIDFKTSRSRWSEEKAQESGEQLLLYAQIVNGMSQRLNLPVKLHFAVLTKAKKPVVQLLAVKPGPNRLDSLKVSVGQVWESIKGGNFYPNPSPQNCSTCPFRSRCPVFAGR